MINSPLMSLFLSPSSPAPEVASKAIRMAIAAKPALEAVVVEEMTFNQKYGHATSNPVDAKGAIKVALTLLSWIGSECSAFEYNVDVLASYLLKVAE